MNFIKKIKTTAGAFGLAVVLTGSLIGTVMTPAIAHETKCPYCKLPVVQDTKELDNEVLLRVGNKRIEYRCVMCAFAQSKAKFKGDLTILAPTNVKGKKVTITRKSGQWSADPSTVVFVYQKGDHKQCQELYRAVPDEKTAAAYAKNKGFNDAKFLTLAQMIEVSK